MFQTKYLEFFKQKKKGFTQIFALICPWILPEYHQNFARIRYCKRGNIRGTLIFADFAVFQQARIQKPAKIFAIFCMHILNT